MRHTFVVLLTFYLWLSAGGAGSDKLAPMAAGPLFVNEVWGKVGELSCLKCHNNSGEAEHSGFILRETILLQGTELQNAHAANFKAFTKMAKKRKPGQQSRLLLKPIGKLDHEGEQVLEPNSTGYRILAGFVSRIDGKPVPGSTVAKYKPRSFFDGVTMIEDNGLLRRLTLSLTGRLTPTNE